MIIARTKNSIRNIFFGIINRIIGLLIPFIIRTIIIKQLGFEFLGLNSLFISILQVLSLAELGFGNALVYCMYKPISDDNYEVLNGILRFYRKLYKIIGSVILILGLILIPFLENFVDVKIIDSLNVNLYILYLIYLFNTVISYFAYGYRKSILQAYQRNDYISVIKTCIYLLLYGSQIILLLIFKNYYIYIICLPVFTILENFVIGILTKKIYPNITCKGKIDNFTKKEVFKKIKALVGHKVSAVLISSIDNIIISVYLNLTILSIYSNYYYVLTALIGFLNVGYTAILGGVGNSIVVDNKEKQYSLFSELSKILYYVIDIITVCLFCLYQSFMYFWLGSDEYLFSNTTMILFVACFYFWQIRIMGLNFKEAAGLWEKDFYKPYLGILIKIFMSLILVQIIGINGILLSTIFIMSIIYFPWETKIIFRDIFKIKSTEYFKIYILNICFVIFCCILSKTIISFIPNIGFSSLIIYSMICILLTTILFFIIFISVEDLKNIKLRIYGFKKNG